MARPPEHAHLGELLGLLPLAVAHVIVLLLLLLPQRPANTQHINIGRDHSRLKVSISRNTIFREDAYKHILLVDSTYTSEPKQVFKHG